MDPNETLRAMREAITRALEKESLGYPREEEAEFYWSEAGAHAHDLDRWLSKGGSLPDAWGDS